MSWVSINKYNFGFNFIPKNSWSITSHFTKTITWLSDESITKYPLVHCNSSSYVASVSKSVLKTNHTEHTFIASWDCKKSIEDILSWYETQVERRDPQMAYTCCQFWYSREAAIEAGASQPCPQVCRTVLEHIRLASVLHGDCLPVSHITPGLVDGEEGLRSQTSLQAATSSKRPEGNDH